MLSQPENESGIVNSFRELLTYVNTLGENINQIYDHLEQIESDLIKAKEDLGASIAENKEEIANVKKTIITKSEFNDILKKLNQPFEKFTPPKAPERPRRSRSSSQSTQEKKKVSE